LDRLPDIQLIEPKNGSGVETKAAKIAESVPWPCGTCGVREAGICRAFLRIDAPDAGLQNGRLHQDFQKSLPRRNIYDADRATENVFVVCSGWAFRFVQLPDGRRQTLSILLPSDLVSGMALFARKLRYSVQALTKVTYCRFNRAELMGAIAARPELLNALTGIFVDEQERADEAITDLGRRSASERIARFMIQLMNRLAARDMVRDHAFDFPLRQQHIADTVGLTTVHVSRVIGAFRQMGLIELGGGRLKIHDLAELRRIADLQ